MVLHVTISLVPIAAHVYPATLITTALLKWTNVPDIHAKTVLHVLTLLTTTRATVQLDGKERAVIKTSTNVRQDTVHVRTMPHV